MASERTQRRIDSLLDEAEEAIAQLHWQVVQTRSQAALALDPNNPDAINYLAAAERALEVTSNSAPPTITTYIADHCAFRASPQMQSFTNA